MSTYSQRDGEAMTAVLDILRPDVQRLYGVSALELHVQQRISRPFSQIAKVRLEAPLRLPALFVKLARPRREGAEERALMTRRVEHDYAVTRQLHAAMDHRGEFAVVRPVACYPEHLAIVTEEAPGETLLSALERRVRRWQRPEVSAPLEAALTRLGQWLQCFQTTAPAPADVSPQEIVDYIDVRLRRLADHRDAAFTGRDRDGVLRAIDAALGEAPAADRRAVPIHADLAPGNVIVSPDRIVVLDLAMTSTGTRYHDLAHMYMQLGLLRFKPQFAAARLDQLRMALLRGYSPGAVEHEPLFQVMLCQHVVCHYLGLVERHESLPSRLYNRVIARSHLGWLRGFSAPMAADAVSAPTHALSRNA